MLPSKNGRYAGLFSSNTVPAWKNFLRLCEVTEYRILSCGFGPSSVVPASFGGTGSQTSMFQKAQKTQSRLRLAVEGPAGAGKTFSSLILAKSLSPKIAVIDTEHGSASLYADRFDFDVVDLRPPYTPEAYIEAIKAAQQAGYGVCVIDSLSHEWTGEGGCLSIVDALGKGFAGWKNVTPRHERLINAILQSDMLTRKVAHKWNPDAKCPRWLQFLNEIFQGDKELISFVQRAAGYSITGETSEHCMRGRVIPKSSDLQDEDTEYFGE